VAHVDIHADDVGRAIAFYQTVFGWSIEKVEGMDYWLITTGEGRPGIDGGLSKRESPTHPLRDRARTGGRLACCGHAEGPARGTP
jgi:predicted enzyme related to lactoylglutathione lyase